MSDHNTTSQAILEAIQLLKKRHGSYAAGARALGVRRQTLNDWKRKRSVPPTYVLALSRETDVSVHDLCPEIFGPAPEPDDPPMAKKKARSMEVSAA